MNRTVYLSLGSNVGDRKEHIEAALAALHKEEIRIVKRSSFYETEPWGEIKQSWFLNMCVKGFTYLPPEHLLRVTQAVEHEYGRNSKNSGGPRTIDIDILLYDDVVMKTNDLIIPHPRMTERRFVLVPLVEIAREVLHPVLRKTVLELLGMCKDDLELRKVQK